MIVKQWHYSEDTGFSLEDLGDGFGVQRNIPLGNFCLTYNYKKEPERYHDEQEAVLLTDYDALIKLSELNLQNLNTQIETLKLRKDKLIQHTEEAIQQLKKLL